MALHTLCVYVRHAITVYWGGVRPGADGMEHYESKMQHPVSSTGVQKNEPCDALNSITTNGLGLVNPDRVFSFYDELHAYLASAGIDGVKSVHPMAEYHAAARAVSGCAIYVSDKPGNHDFNLLKKLVLPDGSILRAKLPENAMTIQCESMSSSVRSSSWVKDVGTAWTTMTLLSSCSAPRSPQ
uniref:Uncharacterized protein n=1 Tax=Oryza rufipogon TaxID=4529 RepID=A0A0E0R7R8_ORYRU